ncbi:hypothetical protein ACO34A_22630 (plasmid) [Rhizobium sp. ACO-34A]|nr:ABC transporter permease [Rhizobium sp. ACO-34A]ATN36587.1 hypothetical protein ACO34A_22630 [Rhizobium sp. ACO-34A]
MDWSDPIFWEIVLGGMIRLATPVFLAAIGEMITERAGTINLGIDGIMTAGAFAAVVAANLAGWPAGVGAALVTGALYGLLLALCVIRFQANQIVVGIALSLIGAGLTSYFFQLWQPSGQVAIFVPLVPKLDIAWLGGAPFVGTILFGQNVFVYGMVVLLAVSLFVMQRTRIGLALRAVGDDPAAASLRGVHVTRVRYLALTLGGALMGLAGASITLGVLGSFNDGLTNGRGYIALAVVMIGRWSPLGAFCGALAFAFFDSLGLRWQGASNGIPSEVFSILPYVMTLAALVLTSRGKVGPRAL